MLLAGGPAADELPPAPRGSVAERWELVLHDYFWAADLWGWPPTVIDEQPALVMDDLLNVALAVEQHRREQAERARED